MLAVSCSTVDGGLPGENLHPHPNASLLRAHKGRYVSDLTLALMAFSLSHRERGRNTYPCQPVEGDGKRALIALVHHG